MGRRGSLAACACALVASRSSALRVKRAVVEDEDEEAMASMDVGGGGDVDDLGDFDEELYADPFGGLPMYGDPYDGDFPIGYEDELYGGGGVMDEAMLAALFGEGGGAGGVEGLDLEALLEEMGIGGGYDDVYAYDGYDGGVMDEDGLGEPTSTVKLTQDPGL